MIKEQDMQLTLEEWNSLDRQIKNLTERKKNIESELANTFSTKDGALSTVHNVSGFAITKKEGGKYSLSKKEFNALTEDEQMAILSLGVVKPDVTMVESNVRNLAKDNGELLSKCFTYKQVNEVSIKFKGE